MGASCERFSPRAATLSALLTKILAAIAIGAVLARLFVRRDSEIARRFRIFVDVCLVLIVLVYGARLIQLYVL